MSEVDYGYGEPEPDYGYGDDPPAAATDYGYGDDAGGGGEDYGYGDAAPGGDDYGYGDAAPGGTDYGYGDDEPTPLPKAAGRPKRRCSVTKFSLDSGPPPPAEAPPEAAPEFDEKDTEATASCNVSTDGDEGEGDDMVSSELQDGKKKKTMMSKLRKRMSLAF